MAPNFVFSADVSADVFDGDDYRATIGIRFTDVQTFCQRHRVLCMALTAQALTLQIETVQKRPRSRHLSHLF